MVTAKRLYLYGVMGVALVPLLWGLWSILRLAARALGAAADARETVGADVARDELSLAVALVIVALPVWLIHAWAVQRSLRASPAAADDERASTVRAIYLFLVLVVTGGIALLQLYEVIQQALGSVLADWRTWGLAGALAAVVVTAVAWAVHVVWRGTDLRASPARTAGDWLTRAYLYGGLFITALLLAFWLGEAIAVVVSELADARAYWEPWQEAIVSPLAGSAAATTGWLALWIIAARLVRADPPMGSAHRSSRTRTAYFLAVLLVSTALAIVLVSSGGRQVLAELLGVWRPSDGSTLASEIGGPLIMAAVFALVAWWHRHQALDEAGAFGGPARREVVWRGSLYVVALVSVGALAVGLAWTLYGLIEYLASATANQQSEQLREGVAPGVATALAGAAVWAPTWRLVRHDHAADRARSAASFPRRAYLLLVSAVAVVVVMAALAYLVYQAIRMFLDAGPVDDPAWAVSAAAVAGGLLGYHLWLLRADGATLAAVAAAREAADVGPAPAARVGETVRISAPPGVDLEALNVVLREALPDDVELTIVDAPEASRNAPEASLHAPDA